MNIRIEIDIDKAQIDSALKRDISETFGKVFGEVLEDIPFEARFLMSMSPPNTAKAWNPSFVGNPPRNQTFALNRSYKTRQISQGLGEWEMLFYGQILDENKSRPFIENTVELAIARTKQKL